MSRETLKTLFHPFASGTVEAPGEGERVLFLGAEAGFALPDGFAASLSAVQGFRPLYRQLLAQRIEAKPEIDGDDYDAALVLCTKHKGENEANLAAAIARTRVGGLIVVAGAKINIEDDGTVKIASSSGKEIEAARKWIHSIVAEPEVGQIYEGTVVKTADFGAFVNFFGARDGLVHISQLASERVAKTSDVVKEGDKVWVKLMGFDERGKVRLSMKVVDQATGKEIAQDKKKSDGEEDAA